MKLYTYDHCPFCVKARMIFGLKHIPVTNVVLLNDDSETPIRMVGRKLVPILEHEGRFMPESMDIVAYVDAMDGHPVLTGPTRPEISRWLTAEQPAYIPLILPRFGGAPLPEFATTVARLYFIRNKEDMVGPFNERLAESPALRARVNAGLAQLAGLIVGPAAVNGVLSTDDIHLFAYLRSLTIVAELEWPEAVRAYCAHMSQASGIALLDGIAA
ncbi:glutaredoxin 2 [Komagataeibacter sp. FNDCR2]|uniref:glutaredoxin 2 n=1 Tax=Komagataeibacter sp. FNDCR2 TaxID=2878682 RepID=UPI001E612D57|nr:glutaredoxin 2 [Komagataeibacter sp. FNDCR2]MCE2575595.1 glutaredoxin 2 [Komagataeibacter sp. FNDCR2]